MITTETEELQMVRDAARSFALEHVAPYAQEWDRQAAYPDAIVKQLGELGFMGIMIPEELDGAGGNYRMFATVLEEIARHDGGLALAVEAHNGLCLQHIMLAANDGQKAKFVPPLARGEVMGSWCLSEPGSGSDAAALKTRAVRDGDQYLINGAKQFITNGSRASTFVVTARTGDTGSPNDVSAFIVDADNPGLSIGKKEEKLGMRSSDTVVVSLDDACVSAESMLGEEGSAFETVKTVLLHGRVMICAISLGLARGALEESAKYASERSAFGQTIDRFQMIQEKIANMAMNIEAGRLLMERAADHLDQGEASIFEASTAKLFCSEMATKACMDAIQILGGYGYLRDYNVERYMRDAKLCEIGEGTSEIMRILIAKHLPV